MKQAWLTAIWLMLACGWMTAAAADYRNPILYSDYSDPDVIRVGDRYLMTASSFHFSPGLPLLESRDLVHWSLIGHALPRLPFDPKYDLPGPLGFSDGSERARRCKIATSKGGRHEFHAPARRLHGAVRRHRRHRH